jgi:hypothetical protein
MPGKRVQFDNEIWTAIDMLARDQMKSFPELADEAFRDLLKKYGCPADLKEALRRSAGKSATVHELHPKKKKTNANRFSPRHPSYAVAEQQARPNSRPFSPASRVPWRSGRVLRAHDILRHASGN